MNVRVDMSDLKALGAELRSVHRAALPNTVRSTLNSLANDVKVKTLPKTYKESFIVRSKTFRKAHTGYEKATGYDIATMKSVSGMTTRDVGTNKAVTRMVAQEQGGSLSRKSIPNNAAREGGKFKKPVQVGLYLKKIKIVAKNKNPNKSWLAVAVKKSGVKSGGAGKVVAVLWKTSVFEIHGWHRNGKMLKLHLLKLYDVNERRTVKLKPRKFVENAAKVSLTRTDKYFTDSANYNLNKFRNRK